MLAPCEYCGKLVKHWNLPVPACCHECRWIPAVLSILALILTGLILWQAFSIVLEF